MVSDSFIESFKLSEESEPRREKKGANWLDYLTPIRNQKTKCGSCYAFGTAALIETVLQISINQKSPSSNKWLSPQEIIDCSSFYGNYGCSGGNPGSALKFLKENGSVLDQDYQYKDFQSRCSLINKQSEVFVDSYFQLEKSNQSLLEKALLKTPVVVAIHMDDLFHYSSGIFSDWNCNTMDLDHVVLLVGYGTDEQSGLKYWLLKNSYGPDWGEEGFFRLERKTGETGKGICGITERAFISTIKLA